MTRSSDWPEQLAARPDVVGVVSPFGPGGSYQISQDGHIAYLTVNFTTTSDRLPGVGRQAG